MVHIKVVPPGAFEKSVMLMMLGQPPPLRRPSNCHWASSHSPPLPVSHLPSLRS